MTRGSPAYGSPRVAAGAQQEDIAGDPPRDYSGIGGRAAESPKAEPQSEPPARDDAGYEREREWYEEEDEDEWFTPHQENDDRRSDRRSSRRRRANADNQGSLSNSHAKDKLIIDALKSIVNRQDLPSKPPMGKFPSFNDSYRTFPRF